MNKLLRFDWDIIAGITAAVLAIVLHLLHFVELDVLFTIGMVLLALLLFRDLRREGHDEHLAESVRQVKESVHDLHLALDTPEAVLIGPRYLRTESRRFCENARGEMTWYNVCFTMFQTQEVFDLMLRPAIENPLVESIQFIADERERDLWVKNMAPKIQRCAGAAKVREPRWGSLPETVSFILSETGPRGSTEALLSFWGEPFMSRETGKKVPRFIFKIQAQSDLIAQFVEMERHQRLSATASAPG